MGFIQSGTHYVTVKNQDYSRIETHNDK